MRKLRRKLIILCGSAVLLVGCFCPIQGQYTRRVRVYRPGTYDRTRTLMSRRAATRKVVKKRQHAVRKRRQSPR